MLEFISLKNLLYDVLFLSTNIRINKKNYFKRDMTGGVIGRERAMCLDFLLADDYLKNNYSTSL